LSPLERLRQRRGDVAPEPGMVRAEDLPRVRRAETAPAAQQAAPDPALVARRERLAERLTLIQLELGGLLYEMATRNHIEMDVLLARVSDLRRADAELAHVDDLLTSGTAIAGGACPTCQAPHARGATYCWQCGAALEADATTE
jgi:hypothetical protein